ncbi:shikimate dehydrogenase family protein [Brevibacterium spongiae]|uniref:Shikimate dehydrogenase n=1 Tax=Brevibacterium spongiae TaxID=2909672 RepID=A0ABY5SJ21_9MICO|nr:shikimate dehydrogenase [Brevibacterium spongiae]UVI34513.1 shikimate dehydrogenase [Brevibacterium spongiae]
MRIRAAVLGSPIAHSKSPLLHRSAFAALGLDTSEYSRFELVADELEAFLDAHPQHTGFSLTMPLKDRLVELAGIRGWSLEDTAALTGAGNTLVRTGSQTAVANTDVRGIVRAVAPHLSRARGDGAACPDQHGAGAGRATILGAGATAASAMVACRDLDLTHVDIRVRNPNRTGRVLDLAAQLGLTTTVGRLDRIDDSEVVISTLPAEAVPEPIWAESFTAGAAVALDVAYAAESAFLAAAAAHGLHPVDGTAMLVEQAVAQFELFLEAARQADASVDDSAQAAAASGLPTDQDLPAGDELREQVADAMYAALAESAAAPRA